MTQPTAPSPVPAADQPVPAEYDLLCENCGYSLIGLMHTTRCPECGVSFNPNELPLARVPWLYRNRLGAIRSFCSTVMAILTGPRKFAAELCRPIRISASDAKEFRQILIVLSVLSVTTGALGWAVWEYYFTFPLVLPQRDLLMMMAMSVSGFVALCVFVTLATDLPTFIWRGLASSPLYLAPLHHYAAAPLALIPVAVYLALAGRIIIQWSGVVILPSVLMIAMGIVIAIYMALMLWSMPIIFMEIATHCSIWRKLALGLYLPFHWLMILAMCFLGWFVSAILVGHLLGVM